MVDSGGLLNLKRFLLEVESMDDSNAIYEIFENIFNIMIVDLDEKLNLTGNEIEELILRVGEKNAIAKLFRIVTKDFILGATENAPDTYTELQGYDAKSADEEVLLEILSLRVLTLMAFNSDDPDPIVIKNWKKEALYFISENNGSLDSYLLELHLLLNDLYQSIDPLTVLEKIFSLLETAFNLYPLSIELHVFKFKLLINDPREEQSDAIDMLNDFQNDSVYGNTVIRLLNIIKMK